MRIDKFLKLSKILKRRTVATEAAKGGYIKINGVTVKPSHPVKVGDIISVAFNNNTLKFRVNNIKETVKKDEIDTLYTVIEE